MEHFREIQIDLDFHKTIEESRARVQVQYLPDNQVLRRLVDVDRPVQVEEGRPWSGKGVTLLHGTALKMEYNGRMHTGRIENGRWRIEGEEFNSPSAAAGCVAPTKKGTHPSLDGWKYRHVRRPGDDAWTLIDRLRRRRTSMSWPKLQVERCRKSKPASGTNRT